jgi:hypothetical protein
VETSSKTLSSRASKRWIVRAGIWTDCPGNQRLWAAEVASVAEGVSPGAIGRSV